VPLGAWTDGIPSSRFVVVMEKDAGDYEAEVKAFMLYTEIEGQWRGNHPNFKDEARWWCRNKQVR